MRLIYEDTGKDVKVGDLVQTFRGDEVVVEHIAKPHSPASTGRVYVSRHDGSEAEFFPSVIGAKWIEREDQK